MKSTMYPFNLMIFPESHENSLTWCNSHTQIVTSANLPHIVCIDLVEWNLVLIRLDGVSLIIIL